MAKEFSLMAPKLPEMSPLINDLKMSWPIDTRDAGFCSGEDEELDVDLNSPTDASEDSVDVKVHAIGSLRSKRKCIEPRKVGEVKKRFIQPKTEVHEELDVKTRSPFRPWSRESPVQTSLPPSQPQVPCGYIPANYRPTEQEEPLSLVIKNKALKREDRIYKPKYAGRLKGSMVCNVDDKSKPWGMSKITCKVESGADVQDLSLSQSSQIGPPKLRMKMEQREEESRLAVSSGEDIRHVNPAFREESHETHSFSVPSIKQEPGTEDHEQEENTARYLDPFMRSEEKCRIESEHDGVPNQIVLMPSSSAASPSTKCKKECKSSQSQQRNYKNMTRERRMEANARERTRVHTISAAFDTLRRTVPAYSHNQKLSKLSVLRIACSYIMTLSRLAGMDYSADQSEPSVSSCVENVSKTIQMEGKLRKKKEDH